MSENQEVKPISPDEARTQKASSFPAPIIEAVNLLLRRGVQRKGSSDITFRQDTLLEMVLTTKGTDGMPDTMLYNGVNYTSSDIFKNHWFDFEEAFRAVGWTVEYDKPAYNETYEPTFIFSDRPGVR